MEEKKVKKTRASYGSCKISEWERLEAELPRHGFYGKEIVFLHRYRIAEDSGFDDFELIENRLFGIRILDIEAISKITNDFCSIKLCRDNNSYCYNINELRRRL